MSNRQLNIAVSNSLLPTKSDVLTSDCLRIECSSQVKVEPKSTVRVNLTVHNSSQVGRMAQIHAQFDSRLVSVYIPNSSLYVGADSKTVVYAIINPLIESGNAVITFDVA